MSENNERRSYFRIDDVIGLKYEVAGSEESQPVPDLSAPQRELERQLQEIDREFNRAANTVWQEDPAIALALGLLNKKVAVIAQHCAPQDLASTQYYDEYTANISGSGMAFRTTECLAPDTPLDVSAILKPSNVQLQFTANVVSCERVQEMPQELFMLRVRISDEDEAAREQLVQHVVQKQWKSRATEDEAREA